MAAKLQEKINKDLIAAMREKQEVRLSVLRMISSAFHKREIEKRGAGQENTLSDDECLGILRSELKKRKESRDLFVKGGRNDLAEKEVGEISIIAEYLPPELSHEEIERAVRNAITKTGATSIKQMGLVMKEVSQELKGNVDGSVVSSLVREILPS
jgi:hypothetical protein